MVQIVYILCNGSISKSTASNPSGQVLCDGANAPSKLVSVVYAEEIKMINFQLKDNSGSVLEDTTITVQQGEQRLNFGCSIPIGSGLQLGVDTETLDFFNNNTNQLSLFVLQPFRNYYFYYDIEMNFLVI